MARTQVGKAPWPSLDTFAGFPASGVHDLRGKHEAENTSPGRLPAGDARGSSRNRLRHRGRGDQPGGGTRLRQRRHGRHQHHRRVQPPRRWDVDARCQAPRSRPAELARAAAWRARARCRSRPVAACCSRSTPAATRSRCFGSGQAERSPRSRAASCRRAASSRSASRLTEVSSTSPTPATAAATTPGSGWGSSATCGTCGDRP